MKAFKNLSPEEREELQKLSMQVRPVDSELDKKYKHLLAKFKYFAEGDHDAIDDMCRYENENLNEE